MYYEDARIKPGDTISGLAAKYCYKAPDREKIWKDPNKLGVVSSTECCSILERMIWLDRIKLA
jgi:hypothetical protein